MGGRGSGTKPTPESLARSAVMATLYRNGYTLQQISEQYGISRERVRQVMTKHLGIRQTDGGQHVKALRSKKERTDRREAKCLAANGCTLAQYEEVLRIGREMQAAGAKRERTPTGAFIRQRTNAAIRGIGWELTFWQWWTIWQQSGHWEQRGRGQGYVMCRRGDSGPYAAGNVFIATAAENSSEGSKKSGLPLGVRLARDGKHYAAHRSVNGTKMRLGLFDTPELAHAAYLMAAPQSQVAA